MQRCFDRPVSTVPKSNSNRVLEQSFNFIIKIFYLRITFIEGVTLVYKEEGRYLLHVVTGQILRVNTVFIVYTYPRQRRCLGLPEMFVRVNGHLIYLQSACMVLII